MKLKIPVLLAYKVIEVKRYVDECTSIQGKWKLLIIIVAVFILISSRE